jgi:hypothetical protein
LSLAQEIAKAQQKDERNPERTAWPANSQILTPERISVLVQVCAQNTVDGMLAQDLDDFDGACMHFSLSLRPLFPEFDNERILKASEAFTSALFAQSKLKDNKFLSKEETLHDERWEYVRNELIKMCELLDIPKSYASETTEWFRYHGVRDDAYVRHLLEAHRVLVKRVAGSDRWYRELGGLYLCAVALHDKHQKEAVLRGREIMVNYFDIMLKAREESTPTVTRALSD